MTPRSLPLRTVLLPALCAAAALACGCEPGIELTEALGGPAGRAAVAEPASVEIVRLEPVREVTFKPGEHWEPRPLPAGIDDYRVTAGPVAVSGEQAAAVSEGLNEPWWLPDGTAKACGAPVYGVRLRFTGEDGTVVDVWNCFRCDDLAVVIDGEVTQQGDSGTLRPALLAAARAAFPEDEALAALKPSG